MRQGDWAPVREMGPGGGNTRENRCLEKQPAASSTSRSWKWDGGGGCLGEETGCQQKGKMPGWVAHERAGTGEAG